MAEAKQKTRLWNWDEEWTEQRENTKELEDEEVEKEMQERMRRAALRPIEVHPDRWQDRSHHTYQSNLEQAGYQTTVVQLEKEKKEKVRDLLLTQPIAGELYIGGNREDWRKVVLKWVKDHQSGNTIVVSMQNLIAYMKSFGVTFHQNDQLVEYPIKNFLIYYEKTLKAELKKKIVVEFE
ncbi:hypothetical protein JOC78_001376 [Bacillus ectoiniformans]|uniref:hypothetical protein n=1 Tax=Bacillus ectoiniformans TaxID=1494429 RepID=UPI00195D17AB|nr:hypothetical protein [Bacillus ectoiniformans]MBM7648434.1 hypothetical protein [Bacillus ectoiniformans]